MLRDENNVAFNSLDAFNVVVARPSAFAGGTSNARGDDGGTGDPYTLFTVTGDVLAGVFGVCTVDLVSAGGGTVAVGVTGNTAALLPVTTATDIDANDSWFDTTPAVGIEPIDSLTFFTIVNGLDIIETIGTADVTAGNIYYICLWRPLTPGSSVVSAV